MKKILLTLLMLLLTSSVISAQTETRARKVGCENRLHILQYVPGTKAIRNNLVTDSQKKWLNKQLDRKDNTLCIVSDLSEADYVFVWIVDSQPQTLTRIVPVTTTTNGSGTGTIGRDTVYINTNSTSTTYVSQSYERDVLYVTGVVARFDKAKSKFDILSEVTKIQIWRWSKPDKDVLVDSLKRLSLID
jgi:hypothetical protein